jgi:hypothetical protein
MGRPRKASVVLESIEDCTKKMGELLVAITDLEIFIAERDVAVAAAGKEHEALIDDAAWRKADAEAALKSYYYLHAAQIEKGGAKHLDLSNGRIGRRDDPPALKPLNRAWTWAAIAVMVRDLWPGKYFHEAKEPELDKDVLKTLAAEELKKAGLKVEAGETFYAEPARLPAEGSK